MAIVSFDGLELKRLSGWENRPQPLKAALAKARSAPSYGFHRLAELKEIDNWRDREREHMALLEARSTGGSASPFGAADGGGEGRSASEAARAFDNLKNMVLNRAGGTEVDYAIMLRSQLRSAALAAAAAMREFAAGDGRKAMLLLAGGWPSSALEYAISDGTQTTSLMLDASLTRAQWEEEAPLQPMTDTANLLGFTLYPVDIPGFQRADTIGIGATSDSAFSIDLQEPTDLGVPQRQRELFHHDSLDFLAFETGGESLINAQRMHALPAVYADTRDYYWLGFSRSRDDNDQYHSIDIDVLQPGLKARARTGFLDLSAKTDADRQVEAALFFDSLLDAERIELILGEPLEPWKKRLEVPLDVRIPLDAVTMIEHGGTFVGELEIRISVMDQEGNRASSEVRAVSIQGEAPPPPGAYYTYSTVLEIRNRNHKIVVGVQDILGGSSLAGTIRLPSSAR
ncbi:MAG: hypothetical protein IIA00_05350 [Proteobacteria bacterium]|nr:hypothetical protein [Pseudomonadota bacterium]